MVSLDATLKVSQPHALATLIRILGDIDTAEDMLQEALIRAVQVWPEQGVPDNAVAWLVTTARNRAIDQIRRRKVEARYKTAIKPLTEDSYEEAFTEEALARHFNDDLLRLIFTCCHPALGREAQVALTLKSVAGLTVPEIARAFLATPKTMEQRLTRAKRKIKSAKIPYEIPGPEDLPDRLQAVLAVIYLLFNEGYSAARDPEFIRVNLCEEAIRLARMVTRLFRSEPEVTGLLALTLLQHSRSQARLDNDANIIPLEDQDRSLWDRDLIAEGRVLVEKALRRKQPGPYQIQAAIAAVHCASTSPEDTDWDEISGLYAVLQKYQPSPVIVLNRAVAVSKAENVEKALELLQTIEGSPDMQRYHLFHATRGALLLEQGDTKNALEAYKNARSLAENPSERNFLEERIASIADD